MNKIQEEYAISHDISLYTLIISNVIVIFLAIIQNWEIGILLWTYLIQSIIISLFMFFKIINLKNYSTANYYVNGKQPLADKKTKYKEAAFLLGFLSMFHFMYIIVLLTFYLQSLMGNITIILINSLLFLMNHSFSYFYNKKNDENKVPMLSMITTIPLLRIFPMQIIIVTGVFLSNLLGLTIFMILKTIVDAVTHIIEHTPQKQITKESLKESLKNKKVPQLFKFLIKLNMKNLPKKFPEK